MIDVAKLFQDVKAGSEDEHSLRVVEHFLVRPMERFDLVVSSGYRTPDRQALTDPMWRTKATSQHTLGEAVDLDGDDRTVREAFTYAVNNLRPWQAILYFKQGVARFLHLSIPSRVPTIQRKALLNVDGAYRVWAGSIPDDLRT